MTRLSELYTNKDFRGARHYCEKLFERMIAIYQPTSFHPIYEIESHFYMKILDKYFYEDSKCKISVNEIFGFSEGSYRVKDFEFILIPGDAKFIRDVQA